MKKLITILLFALLLASCKVNREYNVEYKITYKVYYPSETVTKTFTFKGVEGETGVSLYSHRGTNVLYVQHFKPRMFEEGSMNNGTSVESTTAPMQLISVERIK